MVAPVAERDLDVVVFGATGVTGRRVAAYLAERAGETDLSWAPAARDAAKLDRVLSDEVVVDLVGPYTLYGRPVIEACIAGGAHYVDLAGEIPFVAKIARELGRSAE